MKNTRQFRVNSPNVIHETIDGEVVIVNLEKGHYYSMSNTGAEIWSGITTGLSIEELVQKLCAQYISEDGTVETATKNFIAELEREAMIVPVKNESQGNLSGNEKPTPSGQTQKETFTPPVFEKYTDMEELLLLDPIHEVDETGWPAQKKTES